MKKNPWITLFFLVILFGTLFTFLVGSSLMSIFGENHIKILSKNSVFHIPLQGVIIDGKRFLKSFAKYTKDPHVKAIVVEVNSPGGVVGPSQEIYSEILRIREELKKPIVIFSSGVMASGAYYAAVAADKIMVSPGSMVGSIGVIMEFVNLEKLYDWAKISRYTINTGKYKDSGAEYRPMRPDEKKLFQDLVNDVYRQFVTAVAKGRNLKEEKVRTLADGRVFTGDQAKALGLVDETGTLREALDLAAELADLGKDYEIFELPKKRPHLMELLTTSDEDDSELDGQTAIKFISEMEKKIFRSELQNRPLYLMPGVL